MFNLRNASTYKSDVRQIAREWFAKQRKNPQERTVDAKAEEIRKEDGMNGLYHYYNNGPIYKELESLKSNAQGYIEFLASLLYKVDISFSYEAGSYCNEIACKTFLQLTEAQISQMKLLAIGDEIGDSTYDKYRQIYFLNENGFVYMVVGQSRIDVAGQCGYTFYCVVLGKKAVGSDTGDADYNKNLAYDLAFNCVFVVSPGKRRYRLVFSKKNLEHKVDDISIINQNKGILLEYILCEKYSGRDISQGIVNDYVIHHDQYKFDLRKGSIMFLSAAEHASRHNLIGTALTKESHDYRCCKITNVRIIPMMSHNVPTYFRPNVFQ